MAKENCTENDRRGGNVNENAANVQRKIFKKSEDTQLMTTWEMLQDGLVLRKQNV